MDWRAVRTRSQMCSWHQRAGTTAGLFFWVFRFYCGVDRNLVKKYTARETLDSDFRACSRSINCDVGSARKYGSSSALARLVSKHAVRALYHMPEGKSKP